jgi:hypothetical protein
MKLHFALQKRVIELGAVQAAQPGNQGNLLLGTLIARGRRGRDAELLCQIANAAQVIPTAAHASRRDFAEVSLQSPAEAVAPSGAISSSYGPG